MHSERSAPRRMLPFPFPTKLDTAFRSDLQDLQLLPCPRLTTDAQCLLSRSINEEHKRPDFPRFLIVIASHARPRETPSCDSCGDEYVRANAFVRTNRRPSSKGETRKLPLFPSSQRSLVSARAKQLGIRIAESLERRRVRSARRARVSGKR